MFDTSRKNRNKTFVIVSIFVVLVAALIYFICYINDVGYLAVPIAVTISIIMSVSAYYNSDKIVLSMSQARPATKEQNQRMVENLEGLCIAAGLPMPKLYIVEDSAPNAFATGRNPEHSVICVTTGLLDKLNDYELEGVLAHELSHIKNYDILLQTIVTVFVGFVVIASDIFTRIAFRGGKSRDREGGGNAIIMIIGLIFIILSPIFAELMRLALSRNREFLADSSAIELTRNPEGLINALLKISNDQEPLEVANKSTAPLYICNPLKGKDFKKMFSTHPPIEERIAALKNIN
jgi:heat shock protein HtpX